MLGNYNSSNKTSSLSPTRSPGPNSKDFEGWASQHMYRSSYRDMHKTTPVKNKTYAIPGYTGHIPGTTADTNYSKRFAVITRQQFVREKYLVPRKTEVFPQRPTSISPMSKTQGLGQFGGGIEDEYHTVSRFHGKSTIPMTHPNYTASDWTSNYKKEFVKQEEIRPQIFRKTDMEFWKDLGVTNRESTKASGFVQNSTLFDGHGWVPIKKLHGDLTDSEYRNRFNDGVPFHPQPLKQNVRRLNRKALVY